MKNIKNYYLACFVFLLLFFVFGARNTVLAQTTEKLGVHVMSIDELVKAREFFQGVGLSNNEWRYVTIPLSLNDLEQENKWQEAFDRAQELKLTPIVRLVTRFDGQNWQIPNKKDVVDQLTFLDQLDWPSEQKYIIAYNEVNHAAEWGGRLDPASYAQVLRFVLDWAHTQNEPFLVLPAALDLSAPNSQVTREAFTYWAQVDAADKKVLALLDAWNSHSYPNPAFSSSPQNNGKHSIRGFEAELAWLDQKTPKKLEVFITETGWQNNHLTQNWLSSYYEYSFNHVWSNERVKAVTPFVLKGMPGPFSAFSFLDDQDRPTHQYLSLKTTIARMEEKTKLSSLIDRASLFGI